MSATVASFDEEPPLMPTWFVGLVLVVLAFVALQPLIVFGVQW